MLYGLRFVRSQTGSLCEIYSSSSQELMPILVHVGIRPFPPLKSLNVRLCRERQAQAHSNLRDSTPSAIKSLSVVRAEHLLDVGGWTCWLCPDVES